MIAPDERDAVLRLLAEYGWLADEGDFDAWLDLFAEECSYKVVPRENLTLGLPASIMLCDNKNMLRDRILALRKANKYNIHVQRHVIGLPRVSRVGPHELLAQASYTVFQCDQEGVSRLFSVGSYVDRIVLDGGAARLKEKCVIVDSFAIPTLLAVPI
jgi:anthranilate 1,2-dioxygenase small subunit